MTLFHYCSTATFYNITRNRSIWLSSLSSSNDTQEGKTLSLVLRRLGHALKFHHTRIEDLVDSFRQLEDQMDCLGLCLSREGDMLSQWRGYANDAAGVAIGFSERLFQLMSADNGTPSHARLHRVVYDEQEQLDLLRSRFDPILSLVESGALEPSTLLGFDSSKFGSYDEAVRAQARASTALREEIQRLVDLLYVTKNPAFKEEMEWRYIREIDKSYLTCSFRSRGEALVPYLNLKFPGNLEFPFDCVMVGPRNPTPIPVIEAFLRDQQIFCPVIPSTATYR